MIRKVVIPSAGLGTRLLPATKEQPKEMLPILVRGSDGRLCLKPLLHIVFESLYGVGFREFCFITGRGKRSIEDYFTVDNDFIRYLRQGNKLEPAKELDVFYDKIQKSTIIFINQPEPRGFGDAVHYAKSFTGSDSFLVHAGDDLVISKKKQYLQKLARVFEEQKAAATFCIEKVKDPKKYGVVVGERIADGLYQVKQVIEKPSKPPSNFAVVAIYAFDPKIYQAIEETPLDANNEVQLTNAIQKLIDQSYSVYAVKLDSAEKRVDIGNAVSYLKALRLMVQSASTSR